MINPSDVTKKIYKGKKSIAYFILLVHSVKKRKLTEVMKINRIYVALTFIS